MKILSLMFSIFGVLALANGSGFCIIYFGIAVALLGETK